MQNRLMVLVALLVLATPIAAGVTEINGEARDASSDVLLYAEQHYLRSVAGQPSERLVLYRCPDGRAFARKAVQYSERRQAPHFELEDARFGYREGFDGTIGFVRREARGDTRRAAIDVGEALVVDAGFDEFVRSNWSALQGEHAVGLQFLVPSRLASYGFKLRRLRSATVFDEPASVFRLQLSGVFGWFADAIEVTYRDRDRRLLRFEGMTNIRRDPDSNIVARIEFPPAREQAVNDARWQAARHEPLSDCVLGS